MEIGVYYLLQIYVLNDRSTTATTRKKKRHAFDAVDETLHASDNKNFRYLSGLRRNLRFGPFWRINIDIINKNESAECTKCYYGSNTTLIKDIERSCLCESDQKGHLSGSLQF